LQLNFSASYASEHIEICWHLYSWGNAVEAIPPDALRDMVAHYRRSDFAALP
jgi:predicted DNA-binding transcriptional regulator YafY